MVFSDLIGWMFWDMAEGLVCVIQTDLEQPERHE